MQGWFDSDEARRFVAPRPRARPSMALVAKYRDQLDNDALAYLATRGIRRDTATRFWLGRNCRRLTIPCFVRNGHLMIYGIKKRWIGRPPESYIDTYTMEPGSQGASIFNFDRLLSKRRWPRFFIIEGLLDCILLDQMGIPAVAPFGGGGVWSPGWTSAFARVGEIVIVADNDPSEEGLAYANKKLEMLERGTIVLPPGGHKDLGEAHQAGINLHHWLDSLGIHS
jgi:DNA primase